MAEKYNLIPNQLTYQGKALPMDGGYGFQDFSLLYTDKYLNLLQDTQIYNQFMTKRLEGSFKEIDPALQRYSEFSSFLIFKKI